MIKLRGYSVVPGKVEHTIVSHLGVKQCAVLPHGEGLDRQLIAYIVKDTDTSAERPEIEVDKAGYSPGARKLLIEHLAQYMIPALWVELDSLPTHEVSGKVDLDRLPPPTRPQTPVQKEERDPIGIDGVAEVWAATLKVPKNILMPNHSFFDLGGHSLSLAELAAKLSRSFGFRVPVARLADPTTLSGHVDTLRSVRDGQIAAVQADLPAVLRADSKLDRDIEPSDDAKITSLKAADNILLTGATGFLGAFLLNDLLEGTSAHIILPRPIRRALRR